MRAAKIGGGDAAVDESVIPVGRHASVMVAVEVGEEVASAAFDLAETEGVDSEWHAFERFVEGRGASVGAGARLASVVSSLDGICGGPLLGLGMRLHEDGECRRSCALNRAQK